MIGRTIAGIRNRAAGFVQRADNRRLLFDIAICLMALVALALFFPHEAAGAVQVWVESPTFNHCFLILPIAVFMMWTRRDGLAAIEHRPSPLSALLILPPAFAWLVSSVASVLEAQQFFVMTIFQMALLSLLGWPQYRRLIAPLLYLYFLVPSGAEFVPVLQQLTAHFAVVGLKLIGIPVYSNGAVIEIPAGTFAVAEACAGLRFLVATVAFGVFFAVQTYSSIIRRLIFVALSVVVPVIANGLRVFGLIAAAQWLGNPAEALADHLIYGWGFFSVVLIVLVLVGYTFADQERPLSEPRQSGRATDTNWRKRFAAAATMCVAATLAFPIAANFLAASRGTAVPGAAPASSAVWRKVSNDVDWTPIVVAPTRTFADSFSDGEHTIHRFVAYYSQVSSTDLVRSNNRVADESKWRFNSNATEIVRVKKQDIPIEVTTITQGAIQLKVWSFYVIDGEIESAIWKVKLRQLADYFSGGGCTDAFIAIAMDDSGQRQTDNAVISRYLSDMQPLTYLCANAKGKSAGR